MKKLPEIDISEELDAPIPRVINPAFEWLEEKVRRALQEPAEEITLKELRREMDKIAQGS